MTVVPILRICPSDVLTARCSIVCWQTHQLRMHFPPSTILVCQVIITDPFLFGDAAILQVTVPIRLEVA